MKKRLIARCLLAFVVLMFSISDTIAVSGVVVFNKSGCRSRYVVETPMGYSILEWYGGKDPSEGSQIVGDFEIYGMKTIYNVTQGSEGQVWVEDYWLSSLP